MKRVQALLLLIILLLAPFLKVPTYFFCSMGSGAPQAACCCAPEAVQFPADGQSSPPAQSAGCCRIIPMPLGERLAADGPLVLAVPELAGMLAPTLPPGFHPTVLDREIRHWDHAPPHPPDLPLYLLNSSLLS